VFVISPESVHSEFCVQEVNHAVELNKRIVPLALRPVADEQLPEAICFRNWIPVEDNHFDDGLARLVQAIETDLEWEHQHTRLTVKALEWDQSGRDRSFLLRGSELAAAEQWLAAGADKDPGPSAIEQEYLLAARTTRQRRQRLLAGASLGVAAVAIGLLIFALISRSQAVHAARVALARQLGAEAVSEPRIDRAMLLAREAVNLNRDPQTEGTLLATLLGSPAAIGTFTLPLDARPQNIALRPDGRALAVDDNTGKVRFYNPQTHQPLGKPLTASASDDAPTYSPDGSLIAYSAGRGSSAYVAVRDAHSLRLLHRLSFDHRAGLVQLWSPTSGRALGHPVLVAGAPVASISFDKTGQRFSTTGADGSAKIWFTSTLQQEGANLQGDPGHWGNAIFLPDGKDLLVLYDDGKGFRWPTTVGAWAQHACTVAGRNFTREEWARFVSGYSYARVCPR
jgi:hypothetical protein